MKKLIINRKNDHKSIEINTKEELLKELESTQNVDLAEVWITDISGKSMAMFSNHGYASLMYLPFIGSAGFSSRSKQNNSYNEELGIFMKDGQNDTKPLNYFVSYDIGVDALCYFLLNNDKDSSIDWHDDSESEK